MLAVVVTKEAVVHASFAHAAKRTSVDAVSQILYESSIASMAVEWWW